MEHEVCHRQAAAARRRRRIPSPTHGSFRSSKKTAISLRDGHEAIRAEIECVSLSPARSRTTTYRVELSAFKQSDSPAGDARTDRLRFVALLAIRDDRSPVYGRKRLAPLKASFLFHAASDRDCPFALRKIARELIERLPEIAEARKSDLTFDLARAADIPEKTMTPLEFAYDQPNSPPPLMQTKPRRRVGLTMDHYNRRRCGFLAYGIRWHRRAVYAHCTVARWGTTGDQDGGQKSYYAVEITTPELIDEKPVSIIAREIVSIEQGRASNGAPKAAQNAAGSVEMLSSAMNAGLKSMVSANVLPLPVGAVVRAFLEELEATIAFNSEHSATKQSHAPPWRALRSSRFVYADPDPGLVIRSGSPIVPEDRMAEEVAREFDRECSEQTSQVIASAKAHRIWRIFDPDDRQPSNQRFMRSEKI
jgi:hypothetical protein